MRHIPVVTLLAAVVLLGSCSDDDPAAPAGNASVEGKVTFVNSGSWPASGDVQVSVYSSLPSDFVPTGPPDGYTNPIASGTEYSFKISGLDEGTYAAIYVSWRDPAVPGSATLLGMYWTHVDSLGVAFDGSRVVPKDPGPAPLSLTGANANRKNLDFVADLDLVP